MKRSFFRLLLPSRSTSSHGGTKASAEDEWLELANNTDHNIDLTHFTLVSADGGLTIPLTGSIAAHGFFFLSNGARRQRVSRMTL